MRCINWCTNRQPPQLIRKAHAKAKQTEIDHKQYRYVTDNYSYVDARNQRPYSWTDVLANKSEIWSSILREKKPERTINEYQNKTQ